MRVPMENYAPCIGRSVLGVVPPSVVHEIRREVAEEHLKALYEDSSAGHGVDSSSRQLLQMWVVVSHHQSDSVRQTVKERTYALDFTPAHHNVTENVHLVALKCPKDAGNFTVVTPNIREPAGIVDEIFVVTKVQIRSE